MKKIVVFTVMVAVLILGACSQGEPKDNPNTLVYEVNGKKKAIDAETRSDFIKEFKVPDGFQYTSTKDRFESFYIVGLDELSGVLITVVTKGIVESHNEKMYKSGMSIDGAKNIKNIDDEFFQSHYDFYYEADYKNAGHTYTLAKKVDNRVYAIGAHIPGDKLNDETQAKVIAILKSIKF